jgi:DNA polymerase III delta subunit
LPRAFAEGAEPAAVISGTARHFSERLLPLAAQYEKGAAIESMLEPIFGRRAFLFEKSYQKQLGLWSAAACARAIDRLAECEIACKSSGRPGEAIASHALFALAFTASRKGKR